MATIAGKRKREDAVSSPSALKKAATNPAVNGKRKPLEVGALGDSLSIQIVTGSYERVLHGLSATIPPSLLKKKPFTNGAAEHVPVTSEDGDTVSFSDTFLFAAHASAIRCLAVSPPTEAEKRLLATGSSDERINVYSISTTPPARNSKLGKPTFAGTSVAENANNKTLGSLVHHDRAIARLHFPTKGKLFSAAEDNTIAISRTRDWTVLSSIKVPIPKAQGRPSGDTAGPGDVPAGVNDFAIHASQKLMLSVGRGERCMRLWNLMTGKKAGVLNFERELLVQVGEGKHSSGEGRRVLFNESGERYVVGFERGAVVFDLASQAQGVIKPTPPTKLHQMHFVPHVSETFPAGLLATSTDDGRIVLHDITSPKNVGEEREKDLTACRFVAQLGSKNAGVSGRIKDFTILTVPNDPESAALLIVAASSDGSIRLWTVFTDELESAYESGASVFSGTREDVKVVKQIGTQIGMLETANRITCLEGFVADGKRTETADENGADGDLGGAEEDDEDDSGIDGE